MEIALSVIALVISVISGVFTLVSFLWTATRDRKQATLEAYNRLQAEVFDNLNAYRPEEIRKICADNKSADYKKLSGYLARIEHFCVGLNQNIYDKNVFYVLSHGYFDGQQIRSRIEPLIESKNSRSGKQQFYDDTISVLKWMEKKAAKK